MTQAPAAVVKIPTKSPQPARGNAAKPPGRARKAPGVGRGPVLAGGNGRAAARGGGEVIELECGITVYPARSEGGRWRAAWHEDGQRLQCEAASEAKLAAKLEVVKVRLEADAPRMRQPGAALIAHYLDPDRLPVSKRWSRKHAHSQGRLCARYAAPVIGAVTCQDIKTGHMQQVVNAAPTAGEGDRVQRMISALVTAGIDAGYLVNSRLAKVHWQAGDRALPAPAVSVAGESAQWVDPAEIPSDRDVARLGRALAGGARGDCDELMANAAAYSGLRWGELISLTVPQPSSQIAVRAGRATTKYFVGAVADPRVRVTLMTNSGDGSRNDLIPYLPRPRRSLSPLSRSTDRLFFPVRGSWQPAFADGSRSMELDVDENNFEEVSVVPERDYEETFVDFMTGFAIRVENLANPEEFVISDIVTVEGGLQSRRFRSLNYPEGSLLFRF